MEQPSSESIFERNNKHMLIGGLGSEFHHAPKASLLVDTSNSFNSNQTLFSSEPDSSNDDESRVYVISGHTPESPSSPSSSGLRRRRPVSQRSWEDISKSQFFKNNPDGLMDVDRQGTKRKKYKRSGILKDFEKSKVKLDSPTPQSSVSDRSDQSQLPDITDSSSAITSVISTPERLNNESPTVNTPDSLPYLLFTLAELVLTALGIRTHSLASHITFLIWLMQNSVMLVSDPYEAIKRGRSYVMCCDPQIVYQWIKSTWNLCVSMYYGVLWLGYCVFILVVMIAVPIVLSGKVMNRMVSEPIQMTEDLIFDYTRDAPMAFVPIISCPGSSSSSEFIRSGKIGGTTESQVLPVDREVQATVSLTLPESDYNKNLGVFQVRVDFLSVDGETLASIRKPSMLPFRSEPIRLLCMFFNLAPLLTGYSSETQTLDIIFRGYTENKVHTACSRVVIEQRAEFTRGGGIPEIYAASLKLESRNTFLKRFLWYWKSVIYMGMITLMFIVEVLCMLLWRPPRVFTGRRRRRGVSSNNDSSRGGVSSDNDSSRGGVSVSSDNDSSRNSSRG